MTNRKLFFKISNNLQGPYYRNKGVPQGSVLGPILYDTYIIGLPLVLNRIKSILYADDSFFYIETRTIEEGIRTLEENLPKIKEFLEDLELSLCPEKTKLIIFTNQEFQEIEDIELNFNNNIIKPSRVIRYLGLLLDHQSTWEDHYIHIIGKDTKLMKIIKVLRSTWWGGNPQVLINVYKSLIRSTIEYNLFLTFCQKPALKNKFQIIQNQCLRLAAGYRRSTALNVIHGETCIQYLKHRIKQLASNYLIKMFAQKNNSITELLQNLLELLEETNNKMKDNYPILKAYTELKNSVKERIRTHKHPLPYDYEYSALIKKWNIDIISGFEIKGSLNAEEKFKELYDQPKKLAVYTDGSKLQNPDSTGLAILIPTTSEIFQYKIDQQALIFTADLWRYF